MSANRSVQAAQRRRAGPTDSIPGRGPQPSINSAQMFAAQARPGQGPNIPTGRLAGQQAAMQQKQHQQAAMQQQSQQSSEGISGVSKMTIAQAITLITLRLGSVETKLMDIEHNSHTPSQNISIEGHDNMFLIDNNVIQSITTRLESLEKRSGATSTGSVSGPELALLKQQIETMKNALVQSKTVTASVVKDNKELKSQVDNLKTELTETKELLSILQNLTMDNNQKIMKLSINSQGELFNDEFNDQKLNEQIDYSDLVNQTSYLDTSFIDQNELEQSEIVGTNLKELIENEINANI